MRRVTAVALLALSLACARHAPAPPKTYVDSKRGVQFEYPSDWSAEEVTEQNVLLLSSPVQEANWQTNIFIERRRDLDTTQPREQRLATLADNLARKKSGFALQSYKSGVPAGELTYTHTSQGVPLRERELILWLPDGRTLFVTGSAVTSLWSKYADQMSVVFDSVRPTSQ